MTRIPELEQELVAAAARLRSPRRLVRPAARAALAVAAAALVVALAVVVGVDGDDGHRQRAGAQPQPDANRHDAPEAFVPERQRVARTANRWARRFAVSDFSSDCEYMRQPACERESCVRVGRTVLPNCSPPSQAYRRSFARTKVEDVDMKGYRAAARFSNGEVVQLERVTADEAGGGVWLITAWGRNARRGFFEE